MNKQIISQPVACHPSDQDGDVLRRATGQEIEMARAELFGIEDIMVDDNAYVSEIDNSQSVWVQAWVYVSRPSPWVVVTHPGQTDEAIIAEFSTQKQAWICAKAIEGRADVMKRLDSGLLSTEF
ncbi:MAG: hypothetical protein PSV24_08045 [Rhodoferax sp.]|nr:hypothetical protein [Rhodoferax sp.]